VAFHHALESLSARSSLSTRLTSSSPRRLNPSAYRVAHNATFQRQCQRTKQRVRRHGRIFREPPRRYTSPTLPKGRKRREAEIPSSADYLCTSSRDSFHCNGAGSLGSERSQADGKMFLFSSLKLFIKGSVLPRVLRGCGPRERRRSLTREKGIAVS